MNTVKKPVAAASLIVFGGLLSVLAALLLGNPLYDGEVVSETPVSAGIADISENPAGIHRLRGEFHFQWHEFHSSVADFPEASFAPFPGSWKGLADATPYGWASWGATITGLESGRIYALAVGQVLSACEVYINGKRALSIGRPGVSEELETPFWDSRLVRFTAAGAEGQSGMSGQPGMTGQAEIVIRVSNWNDRMGGTNAGLAVGDAELLRRSLDRLKLTDGLVFGVLGVMGLFFAALFIFRPTDRSFLWFALLCGTVGFRALCYDSFTLLDLVPGLPWTMLFRLGYLTFPFAMISFSGFLRSAYPELVTKRLFFSFSAPFAAYIAVIILFPTRMVSAALIVVQVYSLVFALLGMGVIIRACIDRLQGAFWLLAGFSAALVCFVFDILVAMWVLSGISLSHLGMNFCLYCIALMVIERYIASYAAAKQLTAERQAVNKALRRFVPEEFLSFLGRTSFFEAESGDAVEMEMAVLSADIRSFTAIAERLNGAEAFAFLNEYFELAAPIIRTNGGFIAKYSGDGFTALFPRGSEAALTCAVQIQSAVAGWNRRNVSRPPVAVGIGIDSGPVVLGILGDESRMEAAVLSAAVRSAVLFESETKRFHARILISESVLADLPSPQAWFIRPVDRIRGRCRESFVFEAYNNDPEDLRELKWKTQGDLEQGILAWHLGRRDEANSHFEKVLQLNPSDIVAVHYLNKR